MRPDLPLVHYCIIRGDLPTGVMAAELIHAAGESSFDNLPSGTIAVALVARSEGHLRAIERRLVFEDIAHAAIREPDPPWCGALMAIGISPIPQGSVARFLKRLPLLT